MMTLMCLLNYCHEQLAIFKSSICTTLKPSNHEALKASTCFETSH